MLSKYRFTFLLNRIPTLQKLLNIAVYPLFYLVRILSGIRSDEGKNIVIVSLHRLGDTVFTIPAVKEIIKHYDKDVYIVCYEDSTLKYKKTLPGIKCGKLRKNDFFFYWKKRKRRKTRMN